MSTSTTDRARGTGPFYLVAFVCSLLSLDTAARFFSAQMGIDGLNINGFSVELAAVCGVGELTLIACGYAMRHSVRRPDGKPGAAQFVALTLCSAATFMAVALDGPIAGALRAFFGPVLALIALHLALGIEVKVRTGINTGIWAKITSEVRERFLSRLGLGDDGRLAAERTRDRARARAARLATATGRVFRKDVRLVRAIAASGATTDAAQRALLLEEIASLRGTSDLTTIDIESPWSAAVPAHVQRLADAAQRSIDTQRAAAEHDAAAAVADAQRSAEALREAVQRDADEALRRIETQHRSAAQQLAAAQSEAAQIRAAADKVAAEERRAADDYRQQVERAAQQQIVQLIAAARAEAAEIRSAARADAQVLRSAANRSAETPPKSDAPRRSNGRGAAAIEELVAALAQQWPDENPSDRAAIKYLRQRFNGCGDQRARDAAAALRARRGAAPDAADAEHLQVTATKVNGFSHELAKEAS